MSNNILMEGALMYQNLVWFVKDLRGKFYEIHKKRSKARCIEEMKLYAKEYDLKFDGDYLYAFRNHDRAGRGMFNRTTFYEKGEYYRDWHLDANENDQYSFGLGIFPKGNAPVKVHVDDWGCLVNSSNKCRVWAFIVL